MGIELEEVVGGATCPVLGRVMNNVAVTTQQIRTIACSVAKSESTVAKR